MYLYSLSLPSIPYLFTQIQFYLIDFILDNILPISINHNNTFLIKGIFLHSKIIKFPKGLDCIQAKQKFYLFCCKKWQSVLNILINSLVLMGNQCEVCLKSDDDSNRRNQVSLKLHDEKRTTQTDEKVQANKENQPYRPSLSKKDEEYFNQITITENASNLYSANANIPQKREAVKFKNGVVYTGEWLGNNRHGYGVQLWPDGAKYEGYWANGKANGKGKFTHVDGDVYDGDWQDDKACGYGVYTHNNGARYEGEWLEDYQHGSGVESWVDGSKYQGQYREGKKHGKGKYVWKDGSYYDGSWQDNKITGYGVYIWADGRKYVGNWLNNQMHGKGEYTWKDGRKYSGQYQYDKKHGYGQYTWADGRRYLGEWINSKRHGKGKIISFDGNERDGMWQEDRRVRWLDDGNSQIGSNVKTTISKIM